MKNKHISKIINTIFITSILFCLQGCSEKDKQMVLTNDVKEGIVLEENEINDLINKGNDFLNSSEFDKAKECYEKAIRLDITKESTYLTIKDKYMNSNRYDDAYYIIKLAIDNNVSKENMNNILTDIQSKFNPTLMAISINEGDAYTLPSEVLMPINNNNINVPISWKDSKINTSNSGTFTFEGHSNEYGRTVKLTLTISKKTEVQKKDEEPQKTVSTEKTTSNKNNKQKYLTKLDNIQKGLSDLEPYYSGVTVEMKYAADQEYTRWDNALNEIYSELKKSLSSSDMSKLEAEEVKWISNKEETALKAASEFKGGTHENVAYLSSLAQTTKDRCYELVNKYM